MSTFSVVGGVASFNVWFSTVTVWGFSFKETWTSASRFVHFEGGSHTMLLVSAMLATMSTKAYEGCVSPLICKPTKRVFWSWSLASFSAAGNLRTPSAESTDTCDFRCATTNVWASKWSLRNLARFPMVMSVPPFRSLANCLKTSSDTGAWGVPAANANWEKVFKPCPSNNAFSAPPGSITSTCAPKAAVESTKDMVLSKATLTRKK